MRTNQAIQDDLIVGRFVVNSGEHHVHLLGDREHDARSVGTDACVLQPVPKPVDRKSNQIKSTIHEINTTSRIYLSQCSTLSTPSPLSSKYWPMRLKVVVMSLSFNLAIAAGPIPGTSLRSPVIGWAILQGRVRSLQSCQLRDKASYHADIRSGPTPLLFGSNPSA